MVHGKGGKAVAVMQVYYPCEGKPDGDAGRMFNRQQQGLRAGGAEGEGADPRGVLTADLGKTWEGLCDSGVGVVVHMDANLPVRRQTAEQGGSERSGMHCMSSWRGRIWCV